MGSEPFSTDRRGSGTEQPQVPLSLFAGNLWKRAPTPYASDVPYAFPADLAEQVAARWTTFVSRHDRPAPPLPGPADLRLILETAFLASLTREEGRDVRFVLCCAPGLEIPREGV